MSQTMTLANWLMITPEPAKTERIILSSSAPMNDLDSRTLDAPTAETNRSEISSRTEVSYDSISNLMEWSFDFTRIPPGCVAAFCSFSKYSKVILRFL